MLNEFYEMYCEEVDKNEKLTATIDTLEKAKDMQSDKLKSELKQSKTYIKSLENRVEQLEANVNAIATRAVDKAVKEMAKVSEAKIETLENQVAKLKSTLNNNANN